MYNNVKTKDRDRENNILINLSYILVAINFIFVIIINILLAFFSTDGYINSFID